MPDLKTYRPDDPEYQAMMRRRMQDMEAFVCNLANAQENLHAAIGNLASMNLAPELTTEFTDMARRLSDLEHDARNVAGIRG